MFARTYLQGTPKVRRRNAFTLVELLVVVSIIALLIAIMLPSLRNARENAKIAACLSNLTGIAKAGIAYAADDPGEIMIPVGVSCITLEYGSGTIDWGGKAGQGQAEAKEDVSTSPFGTGAWRGPAHRPLNGVIYKGGFRDYNPFNGPEDRGPGNINWINDTKLDLPLYRCPSDTGYAGGGFMYTASQKPDRNEKLFMEEGLTAYDHYGTSYMANTFWMVHGQGPGPVFSQSVYLTPLSRVPTPSAAVAYQEAPSRFAWLWGSWTVPDSKCTWAKEYEGRVAGGFNQIPGWHRRPFNFTVAFADGHASMVEMKGCQRPIPNLGLQNYPYDADCGTENMYDCSACVEIRGPGWALDTLPAPAVRTPFYAD